MLIRLFKTAGVRVRPMLVVAACLLVNSLMADELLAATDGMMLVRQVMKAPDDDDPDTAVLSADRDHVNFRLALRYRCTAPLVPLRVFVSIADTFAMRPVTPADGAGREIDLSVPAGQLVGLDVTKHCQAAKDPTPEELLRVSNVFAATASVVCAAEEGDEGMVSGSAALDLWVQCPGEAQPESAD